MSRAFSAGKLKAEERRAILQAIESQMQQVIIDGVTMVLQEFLEQEVTTKLGRPKRSPRRISSQARPIDCVINTIQDRRQQAVASNTLATMLVSTDKLEQVLHFIQRSWRQAVTRDEALTLFSGAITVIPRISDIGTAFQSAFSWVDNFLNG